MLYEDNIIDDPKALQNLKSRIRKNLLTDENHTFYTSSGIPKIFRCMSLDDVLGVLDGATRTKVLRAMLRENKGAYISGITGVGKTQLAVNLALEKYIDSFYLYKDPIDSNIIGKSDLKVTFLTATEFFDRIKATFGTSQTELTVIENIERRTDLLIFDDFGADMGAVTQSLDDESDTTVAASNWARRILFVLIDTFYNKNKPIIITSNLPIRKLSEQYDKRIASRLFSMCVHIELKGQDRRLADTLNFTVDLTKAQKEKNANKDDLNIVLKTIPPEYDKYIQDKDAFKKEILK